MSDIIDRVKISAAGKQQLSTLKRRTGLEHYNVICRHALCASLANSTKVPAETLQYAGGIEIDWKTFAGEADATLTNILIARAVADHADSSPLTVRGLLQAHLHRGLAYLVSDPNSLCHKAIALT